MVVGPAVRAGVGLADQVAAPAVVPVDLVVGPVARAVVQIGWAVDLEA